MTRRTLLLLIVGVVLVLALFFIVRGRSSSSSTAAVATATPTPSAKTVALLQKQQDHAQLVSFAGAVLPDLTKSATIMNHTAATAATASSVSGQFDVCNTDSSKLDTLQLSTASVQWPPGGSPARKWRHHIFGIFHLYFGAIVECRNAFDTKDAGQAASAVSDLANAARQMHDAENYARSLVGK